MQLFLVRTGRLGMLAGCRVGPRLPWLWTKAAWILHTRLPSLPPCSLLPAPVLSGSWHVLLAAAVCIRIKLGDSRKLNQPAPATCLQAELEREEGLRHLGVHQRLHLNRKPGLR